MSTVEKLPIAVLPDLLLDWYRVNARELPWRVGPTERARGVKAEPYRVWLAEIMLQQTTIAHATRYYLEFLRRWPTVEALGAAADEEVMAAWAGLGYYARARNLLKCARQVAELSDWPSTYSGLMKLPGIGPYSAGAVGALAFGLPTAAVDGNVERVFSRLLGAKGEWKSEKKRIRQTVEQLVPERHPAEFAEGLMDLGAVICTVKRPNCPECPVRGMCVAFEEGRQEDYPMKPAKANRPQRWGHAFVIEDGAGNVLTERRADKGLLGGMMGLPTSDWGESRATSIAYPIEAEWQNVGEVRHVFTHFALNLTVWRAHSTRSGASTAIDYAENALPSVFSKALRLAVDTG